MWPFSIKARAITLPATQQRLVDHDNTVVASRGDNVSYGATSAGIRRFDDAIC